MTEQFDSEDWKEYRKEQQNRRIKRFPHRVELILSLTQHGYIVTKLTPYQYRITRKKSKKTIDIYPVHLVFHDIGTGKRGQIFGEHKLIGFINSRFD